MQVGTMGVALQPSGKFLDGLLYLRIQRTPTRGALVLVVAAVERLGFAWLIVGSVSHSTDHSMTCAICWKNAIG